MSTFLAEVLGTLVLVLLGDGVVANVVLGQTKGHNSGWIVITAGWAFAASATASSGRSGFLKSKSRTVTLASPQVATRSTQDWMKCSCAELVRAAVAAVMPHHARQGHDYVVIARSLAIERSYADLKADLEQALAAASAR